MHFWFSLGISDGLFFGRGGSGSYDGQTTEIMGTSISVDEVTSVDGVGIGGHGSVSVGDGRSVSVSDGGSGIGHSGSGVDNGSGVSDGSDLTDGVNETILVIIFGVSLQSNVL